MKIACALTVGLLVSQAANAVAQGSIAGTVYDSLQSRAPLANATVVLLERSRYATTDANGHFKIDSVPDGHYTLSFMHPVLDALGLQAPGTRAEVIGGRSVELLLTTPAPASVYARLCPDAREPDTGFIIGRVRDVDDATSVADATVSTGWTETVLNAGKMLSQHGHVAAHTTSGGLYLLCGVPIETSLEIRAELRGLIAGPTITTLDDRLIGRIDFALSRRDSAARDVAPTDSIEIAAGPAGTASLRGVVRNADNGNRVLRDAMIYVIGTKRSARSDSAGVFRVDGIPAGTRTIEVKSLGLSATSFTIDFATNSVRDTTTLLSKRAQYLRPVSVRGKENSTSLMINGGFEERRAQGLGSFITEAELNRRTLSSLISVFSGHPIIRINWGYLPANRAPSLGRVPIPLMRGTGATYCRPNIFLDNMPMGRAYEDMNGLVTPESVKGIELYDTPGTIPMQYDLTSSTGCGSIVIWTR